MCFEDLATPRAVSVGSGLVTALGGGGEGGDTGGSGSLSLRGRRRHHRGRDGSTPPILPSRCHLDAQAAGRAALLRAHGVTASQLRVYVHYLPSFWQLHVHTRAARTHACTKTTACVSRPVC